MNRLKSGFAAQQSTMVRQTQTNLSSVWASFRVAKMIARCGKSFSDGEFVKKSLTAVTKEVHPDKKDALIAMSLYLQSPGELKKWGIMYMKEKARVFECFALAMDESNDMQDTTQLLIFIQGINSFFEVSEELAALQSLTDTTTGEDIFSQVCQKMEEFDLDSMIGVSKGLAGLIKSEMEGRCPTTNPQPNSPATTVLKKF